MQSTWPWYVVGPLIGLTIPVLLLAGNRSFGISSSLRHICAACIPGNIPFFRYNWKKEIWNLVFCAGIIAGAFFAWNVMNHQTGNINPVLVSELKEYSLVQPATLLPPEVFSWKELLSPRGLIMIVGGGFLIGFGTRYAGGCTSGHSIMGLSNLQWPSLVATCCFMAGGFFMANLLLPKILAL